MNGVEGTTQKLCAKRRKAVEEALFFESLVNNPDLSEEEIDIAIEELRALRVYIRAIDYGDTPGFRKPPI
ncbi:MAG: hypothetical protein PVG14_19855 [Anaerolineales bacterium]|jgi:hypothetical protein